MLVLYTLDCYLTLSFQELYDVTLACDDYCLESSLYLSRILDAVSLCSTGPLGPASLAGSTPTDFQALPVSLLHSLGPLITPVR